METTTAPTPATVPPNRRRLPQPAFHALGAILVVCVSVAYWVTLVVISFGLSYCNFDPPPAADVWRARGAAALAGAFWTSIPAAMAGRARRTQRSYRPWVAVAVVTGVTALLVTMSIEPSYFCFF